MLPDLSTADLYAKILLGNPRATARAATLIEAQTSAGRHLAARLFPHTGRARVVGITGPPGAGKSTLTDQLTKHLRQSGKTVGIIAVDPSSPYTKGAILGDRIRMGDHYRDSGVFIRSMATRGRLGGVAVSTLELALLLDASGCDVVLIETVGVGQDEVDIARLADVTVVVLVPGFGDDVQAIKAGIMEVADVFALNKADLPGVERLQNEIRSMQSLTHPSEPIAPLCRITATTGDGVYDLLAAIDTCSINRANLQDQTAKWIVRLRDMLRDQLLSEIPQQELARRAEHVAQRMEDPYAAVEALRARMLGS